MGLFKSRKKDILDLTERYHKQQERLKELQEEMKEGPPVQETSVSTFGFFDMASANQSSAMSSKNSDSNEYSDLNDSHEKRRKLAKRLVDLTNRLEDLSNQIYHLQQRLELVEKKLSINNH